jgi:hypothetical protein
MALINFQDLKTVVSAAWLNAVDTIKFTIFADATTKAQARTALTSDLPLEEANGGTGSRTFIGDLLNGLKTLVSYLAIKYPQTAAESAASVTPTNLYIPSHDQIGVLLLQRYGGGTSVTAAANVTAVTNATLVATQLGGGTIRFPSGSMNFNNTLPVATGVNWEGMGKYDTNLMCTAANGVMANNIFVDARGSGIGGFPVDRKIVTFRNLTLDGTNAGNQVKGLAIGWNMRSMPMLQSVRIRKFADYGVGFLDQNWNIDFIDVELDSCGNTVINSSGWIKLASVDGGTFNYINWYNCITEACGSSSSTAGGMNFPTTTANRGFNFIACEWENNRGTDQVLITNTAGIVMTGPYIEMPSGATEAAVGMEFDGCTGSIDGGFISATDSNNKYALQFKSNCDMSARNTHLGTTWNTASVNVQGSILENRNLIQSSGVIATYVLDSTAQLYGDICPRVSAHKNGTDQTGVTTATFTKVTFGTKVFDETNCYASSTYTPQTKRKQRITTCVKFTAGVDQSRVILALYANGAAFKTYTDEMSGTGANSFMCTWLVDNSATNTTWEIYVRQDTGGNLTISGATDETYFMAECV